MAGESTWRSLTFEYDARVQADDNLVADDLAEEGRGILALALRDIPVFHSRLGQEERAPFARTGRRRRGFPFSVFAQMVAL